MQCLLTSWRYFRSEGENRVQGIWNWWTGGHEIRDQLVQSRFVCNYKSSSTLRLMTVKSSQYTPVFVFNAMDREVFFLSSRKEKKIRIINGVIIRLVFNFKLCEKCCCSLFMSAVYCLHVQGILSLCKMFGARWAIIHHNHKSNTLFGFRFHFGFLREQLS